MEAKAVDGSNMSAGRRFQGIDFRVAKYSVLNHLDFLQDINKEYQLTEGPVLNRAIDRYQRYWLPLAAKHSHEALPAPLDIEWVWHCHVLSPVAYEKDCLLLVGMVVPHNVWNAGARKNGLLKSEDNWKQAYPGVPFNVDLKQQTGDTEAPSGYKISYDLVQASARQREFYYHVSLPHYRDAIFMESSMERYRKFLHLLKNFPDSFLAPTYDIDLIWHTHQLDPIQYKADTLSVLGKHLNHDDTVSDRSEDSKLTRADKLTRKLWKKEFSEPFARPGAMYRGESTRGNLHDLTEDRVRNLVNSVASSQIIITELQLDRLPNKVRIAKLEINVPRGQDTDSHTEVFSSKVWTDKKRMLWKDSKLYNGRVDTTTRHYIDFSLIGISGWSLLKKRRLFGSGSLDCLSLHHKMEEGCVPLDETVRLFSSPIQLFVKGSMINPKPGWVTLKLITGQFKTKETTSSDRKEVWGPVPLPPRNSGKVQGVPSAAPEQTPNSTADPSETCYTATHQVRYLNNTQVFSCKVIHSTDVMMSAVYVYHEDKMLACAHVIGSDQLPSSSDAERATAYSASKSLTLDPKIGERAILIKNNTGDWGVVVGTWTGMRKRLPGTKGRYGIKGTPGSYGRLSITFLYSPTKDNAILTSSSETKSGSLKISIGDIIYQENRITIKNHHEAAENVALALSIGILHVLCQPRSAQWKPGLPPNFKLKGSARMPLPPAEDVTLLKAAGVLTYCACNRYLMNIHSAIKLKKSGPNIRRGSSHSGSDGSVGGDSLSLGGDSVDYSDDFGIDSCGMDSCDVDCDDVGGGGACGSGGGGCGGGCGGGGSSCGGGGSNCGGGGGCGGGGDGGGGGSSCGGGGSSCGGGGSSCGGGGGCGGGGDD